MYLCSIEINKSEINDRNMKISLIKTKGKKEVITRYSLEEVAYAIQSGWRQHNVTYLREVYHLMNKERQPDGQIQTDWQGGIKLEVWWWLR